MICMTPSISTDLHCPVSLPVDGDFRVIFEGDFGTVNVALQLDFRGLPLVDGGSDFSAAGGDLCLMSLGLGLALGFCSTGIWLDAANFDCFFSFLSDKLLLIPSWYLTELVVLELEDPRTMHSRS